MVPEIGFRWRGWCLRSGEPADRSPEPAPHPPASPAVPVRWGRLERGAWRDFLFGEDGRDATCSCAALPKCVFACVLDCVCCLRACAIVTLRGGGGSRAADLTDTHDMEDESVRGRSHTPGQTSDDHPGLGSDGFDLRLMSSMKC
eukprot:2991583-Rhodomonas_salina.2